MRRAQGKVVDGPMRLPAKRFTCALVLATAALLLGAASASADVTFCASGSGSGQCDEPSGVAVNSSTGHVYVADSANHRINVFDSAGSFQFAFGWGVADGNAELQSCTSTCLPGLRGGGAGEFEHPRQIAVDPAAPHDVYVFNRFRVQRFSASGAFIAAWGGGVISGGATGKGDLTSGSTTVANVVTTKKAFASGQAISGAGIPAGTRIAAVGPGTITLSKAATASGTGVTLTAPEGAGNIPVNEVQVLPSLDSLSRGIAFSTPDPSPSVDKAQKPLSIPDNAPASGSGSLQSLLEGFSNIDPGDVSVSGPNGGPYTIEFKGRYSDTDVGTLADLDSGGNPVDSRAIAVTQDGGGSAEICVVATDCSTGVKGTGPGQFGSASDPISVNAGGAVYVGDSVQVGFDVGGGIFDSRVEIFEPSGALSNTVELSGTAPLNAIAADSSGDFYVTRTGVVEKYDSGATLLNSFALNNVGAIAVDSSDHLFAAHLDGTFRVIAEFDSSGNVLRRFGYQSSQGSLGAVAPRGPSGDVYGTEPSADRVRLFSTPPPGPLACCLAATPGNTKATVTGGINPEGKATTYHFDYISEKDYVENGSKFEGLRPFISTPESASIGSDFNLHLNPASKDDPPPVTALIGCKTPTVPPQASCLKPETKYRYRLVATNSDGQSGGEGAFETLSPFELKETWATDVGIEEARVHASVNPLGIPTTAQFEYVDDATFQVSGFGEATKAPASPISLGSSEQEVSASTQLSSLAPGTIYHYRVAVSDPFAEETGPELTFTTFPVPFAPKADCPNQQFRTAASAPLPDCRAYEMVSPVDKNGNDIKVLVNGLSFPARLDQGSDDGNRFAYSSSTAFGDAQGAPWSSEYMATREEGKGWSTHSLNPRRQLPSLTTSPILKLDVQYKAFSPDLGNGWLFQDANPPLDECAPEGFINLYRRDNTTGEYEALVTNPPTNISSGSDYRLELQGLSADGSHAVFRANAKLTNDASNGVDVYQLYMHTRDPEGGCGELRLVSFKPNGTPVTQSSSAGTPAGPAEYRASRVARAVSADGSRVFFTTETNPIAAGPLYVRVNADQPQGPVSGGKCSLPITLGCTLQVTDVATQFWTADGNGSRVIYSAGQLGEELFEFNVDKALAGEPAKTLITAGSEGVVGASEDAARIYFVSSEEIDGEGKAGEPNLYLYEPGQSGPERYRLVATLSNRDLQGGDLYGIAVAQPRPIANGVRLSADGSHLAFVSSESLTGYDNADAVSGEPNLEVYLYDTASEAVHCISCNPGGGRPQGRGFGARRVSAMMAPGESQTFAPRALSADGNRLFFESFDALLPRDTNGKADVYEWMRSSAEAQCKEAGAELYVPSAEGCLSLISSGQSPADTEFADASPDGSDVFIRTQSSLLPQDIGLIDIYDARMGGGLPQPPAPPAACEGEACQGPLAPPDDPTPASSAFEGAGNVTAEKKPASCRKPKVRRKGRCVAKKTRKASKSKGHKSKGHKSKR